MSEAVQAVLHLLYWMLLLEMAYYLTDLATDSSYSAGFAGAVVVVAVTAALAMRMHIAAGKVQHLFVGIHVQRRLTH